MPSSKPAKPTFQKLDAMRRDEGDIERLIAAVGRAIVPSSDFRAVTPSDTAPIAKGPAKALFVGGAGNVVAINEFGVAITFTGVLAGSILPIQTIRVHATGTTATNIVAL
jgi:hypothetical protein